MTWDRFSVCTAYAIYASDYNGSREAYAYQTRLRRIFRASPSLGGINDYRDDDRDEVSRIYGNLVMRHNRTYVGYERLLRRSRGRVKRAVHWPGTANMGTGERAWCARLGLLDAVDSYTRDEWSKQSEVYVLMRGEKFYDGCDWVDEYQDAARYSAEQWHHLVPEARKRGATRIVSNFGTWRERRRAVARWNEWLQ